MRLKFCVIVKTFLVPTVLRGNPYIRCRGKIGMHSHGGPWERGKNAGSGIGIEPENAKELAAVITALANAPEKCAAMGEAGKACVSAEFDRRALARRFEEVLESVV
jgi:glycosyltransferase involved in cell wall biosynthesis